MVWVNVDAMLKVLTCKLVIVVVAVHYHAKVAQGSSVVGVDLKTPGYTSSIKMAQHY
jgi:hypothetical protein